MAALGGLPVPVKCLAATTVSSPMTRAGMTIRAASPAPSQLADSGSASCATPGATPGAASWSSRGPADPLGDLVLGEGAAEAVPAADRGGGGSSPQAGPGLFPGRRHRTLGDGRHLQALP